MLYQTEHPLICFFTKEVVSFTSEVVLFFSEVDETTSELCVAEPHLLCISPRARVYTLHISMFFAFTAFTSSLIFQNFCISSGEG